MADGTLGDIVRPESAPVALMAAVRAANAASTPTGRSTTMGQNVGFYSVGNGRKSIGSLLN